MLKQIECRIVESRPLEPCRAIAHRQPDNCRRDYFSRPPRPHVQEKTQTVRPDYFSAEPAKFPKPQDVYPVGLLVDILA